MSRGGSEKSRFGGYERQGSGEHVMRFQTGVIRLVVQI